MKCIGKSIRTPHWSLPKNIGSVTTTRLGGISQAPYASCNLALHVGDEPHHVQSNRVAVSQTLSLTSPILWLEQVHGATVIAVEDENIASLLAAPPQADAAFTRKSNIVLAVMTADCLPILVSDNDGQEVAAIHAGWRSLASGIIEKTLGHFRSKANGLSVWLGPCISQCCFEVGAEVRSQFLAQSSELEYAFKSSSCGRYYADLHAIARQHLLDCGVTRIVEDNDCTYCNHEQFFSYRRDGKTGRMASFIWKKPVI